MRFITSCSSLLLLSAAVVLSGCGDTPTPAGSGDAASTAVATDDHGDHDHGPTESGEEGHHHGAGPNGGTVADWGGGKYHVEFTVDHDAKESVVYVFGSDAVTPAAIEAVDGSLLLTIAEPAFQVELTAWPAEGESEGTASRYRGSHDNLGIVREFSGTISGAIGDTPYAGDFAEVAHAH